MKRFTFEVVLKEHTTRFLVHAASEAEARAKVARLAQGIGSRMNERGLLCSPMHSMNGLTVRKAG